MILNDITCLEKFIGEQLHEVFHLNHQILSL